MDRTASDSLDIGFPSSHLLQSCAALILTLLFTACAADRVIVAYHLTTQVESRDASSERWKPAEGIIATGWPREWMANKFPYQTYMEMPFDMRMASGDSGLVIYAMNKSQDKVCLFLNEARLASNFTKEPIPLRAYGPFWPVHWFFDLKEPQRIEIKRQGRVIHPPLCLAPGQIVNKAFDVDTAALFPSGNMFNVAWREGVAELTDKGVGNWLTVEMPIETAGKRTNYKFTLTARDAKARPLKT